MILKRLLGILKVFRNAAKELFKNDPLRMAAATAFFTTFALPPILVILIQSLGLVFERQKIRQQLHDNLAEIVGHEAIHPIYNTLGAFRDLAENRTATILGFIFLMFVATTLFKVIKASINQVWKVRRTSEGSFFSTLSGRLKAIMVIIVAGVLFMIGLLSAGMQAFIGKYIFEFSPLLSVFFNSFLNIVISTIVVTAWFSIVFRYLPDGRPEWRIAITGGFVTSILFNLGKIALKFLLSYSNLNTIYGTSASVVLLLLFVFYSSLILYFGAAFTLAWSEFKNVPIVAKPHAGFYRIEEIKEGKVK